MATILSIDPGATTGWVVYDADKRAVVAAGKSLGIEVVAETEHYASTTDVTVIERPKGYGPTRPQLVDCGYLCGYVVATFTAAGLDVVERTRLEVCKALTEAVHGVVRVRNDATAWAALKLLHGGDGCDKKGGPLYAVKSHARAALAVAVAYALEQASRSVEAGR